MIYDLTYITGVSHEDEIQKFLKSLPFSWSQVALIMRTKLGFDTLSFDDLYNNLRVFECDIKGTTASLSNTQNVAFVSTNNTSSTNDINDDDIEEMDLKWQVAMISIRIKKFHKRTGRKLQFDTKDPVGFNKTKVKCFNCHKIRHFARDCRAKGNQDNKRRDDIDWSGHVEKDAQNYAMMAYSSGNSYSDNEDAYEKKLIQVLKIHTDDNVADLLTKAFDVSSKDLASPKQTALDLRLDDADDVECLPNKEIFTKLARMGYEKPPPKLTFYKAFLSAQWKFLIHTLVQCRKFNFSKYIFDSMVRNVDSPSKFLIVGKGFLGVETPLFATMLVQPQPEAKVEQHDVEVPVSNTPPSPTNEPSPPPQEPITTPPQAQPAPPSSPIQEQQTDTFGRTDDVSVTKEVSAAEPTVFDDEEVTMTMDHTLIKMKAKKVRLLDEQMAKRLHDEENMAGYKMEHFRGMTFDQVSPIFERKYNKVQTLFKPNNDVEEPTMKRVVEETLHQESFKKLKAVEVSGSHPTQDTLTHDPKEISEEDVKNMLEIVLVSEFKFEAL
nr:hypothetical protein [Tanacetum cinerariifolium]